MVLHGAAWCCGCFVRPCKSHHCPLTGLSGPLPLPPPAAPGTHAALEAAARRQQEQQPAGGLQGQQAFGFPPVSPGGQGGGWPGGFDKYPEDWEGCFEPDPFEEYVDEPAFTDDEEW